MYFFFWSYDCWWCFLLLLPSPKEASILDPDRYGFSQINIIIADLYFFYVIYSVHICRIILTHMDAKLLVHVPWYAWPICRSKSPQVNQHELLRNEQRTRTRMGWCPKYVLNSLQPTQNQGGLQIIYKQFWLGLNVFPRVPPKQRYTAQVDIDLLGIVYFIGLMIIIFNQIIITVLCKPSCTWTHIFDLILQKKIGIPLLPSMDFISCAGAVGLGAWWSSSIAIDVNGCKY